MQDRQIQVRAGSARAAGRLRETDGMMMGRSGATAQWVCIIQPEEVSIAAESWLTWTVTLVLTVSPLNLILTAFSLGSF